MRRLREDSLAPGLLVTGAALLVATFGPEKAHRVPETRLPPECTDSALAICACELLPETRVADITFQWNEVADCNLHAAHQPGVSYVSDIERICRTGGVVAEAAGPFRSQMDDLGPFEMPSAAEEMGGFGAGPPTSRIVAQ